MRLYILAILLSACAAVDTGVYKPNISEKLLANNKAQITVENPYNFKLPVRVDCGAERDMREYNMEPGSRVVFTVDAGYLPACSVEHK